VGDESTTPKDDPEAREAPEVGAEEHRAKGSAPKTVPLATLEAERKKGDELLSRLKYLQADFDNYRKRVSRETEAFVKLANEALLVRLIPVLDDFDAAIAHLDGEASKGVRMVHGNLLKALAEAGLEEIPADGATFDPYVHDCVEQVPDSALKDGTVKEVVRKGYRVPDRILRPAQVIVVKNGDEAHA
jgi:molecular chaperone GrpE